ncbi:MAG: hypothetical protein JWN67_4911 [Actinomycetia bacterium]|nr:hypothetical protein [Actinomycetes bacterium]
MTRVRSSVAIVLGLVAASTLLGGSARADDEGATLSGYQGQAAASGLHVTYNPVGLLPLGPLVDVGAPDALATVASGPATFARAGVADPGDILANPDAVFALADSRYPQGTIPAYPYRVTASSGAGEPRAESNPAPGLNARAEAQPDGSSAQATTPAAVAKGFASVGSMLSRATTEVDDTTVQVHARTELSHFELLDVIKITSLVTDVVATSDGGAPKLTGATTISGATVAARPVTIDAKGVHGPAEVEKALADAGIRLTLAGPNRLAGATAGQMAVTGLRIDLELSPRTVPAVTQLTDAVPSFDSPVPGAPSIDDAVVAARAKHLVAIELGGAAVALSASTLPAFGDISIDTGGIGGAGLAAGLDVPVTPGPAAITTPTQLSPKLSSDTPAASVGAGIGALALLALLVQPFVGDRLARAAAAVLGDDAAETCLREER